MAPVSAACHVYQLASCSILETELTHLQKSGLSCHFMSARCAPDCSVAAGTTFKWPNDVSYSVTN